MKKKDVRPDRTEYRKPRLRVIALSAEEVLAGGCKIFSGSAPGIPHPPCWFAQCSQRGS